MKTVAHCPALMVSATASGQGKTSVTAAIARVYARRGKRVRVFKTGPDFLDPMILERASGQPVYQLDLFMGGEAHCRSLLYAAALDADLILLEGVMGLFDGEPSSADLANAFGLPVLAVIDASAMAQTFGAIAHGLATFRAGVPVIGVVANRVASAAHGQMVGESLPASSPLAAAILLDPALTLPERHLGLVQAIELAALDARLDRLADAWKAGVSSEFQIAEVVFEPVRSSRLPDPSKDLLAGVRIAVANDEAFSFIYRANLDTLRQLGAELAFFSPLKEDVLPACDALWLPGGYPELHAERLESNRSMRMAVREHIAKGKPLLAECGGMMYLMETMAIDSPESHGEPRRYAMAGVLPGEARMHAHLTSIGLQTVTLPKGNLRGHSFHHSSLVTTLAPIAHGKCPNQGRTSEAVYWVGALTASYMHFYFPSNPSAVVELFHPKHE